MSEEKRAQHIVSLEAENVKRLKAVRIVSDGEGVVTVGGRNAQGKSSVLDAIEMAIRGPKAAPPEPIRAGAKKSRTVLELNDYTIERTFTRGKSGSKLVVTGKTGGKTPQALLDSLAGVLSFDPLAFVRMDAKAQRDAVRDVLGIDVEGFDRIHAQLYEERKESNREIRRLQGVIDSIDVPDGHEVLGIDVAELAAKLETAAAHNAEIDAKHAERQALRSKRDATKQQIAELATALEKAEAALQQINARGKALKAELEDAEKVDTAEVRAALDNANATNERARLAVDKAKATAEWEAVVETSEGLTKKIDDNAAAKAEAIAGSKLPVDGLEVTADGVMLDGVPFEQASLAQQLKTSVAVGLANNPELRIMLVRDGSLLDDDSMAELARLAEAHSAQLWVERVTDGKPVSVVIEDGEVLED